MLKMNDPTCFSVHRENERTIIIKKRLEDAENRLIFMQKLNLIGIDPAIEHEIISYFKNTIHVLEQELASESERNYIFEMEEILDGHF